MRRATQNMLYHLLPVVFWLLAAGGIAVWEIFASVTNRYTSFIPAFLALLSVVLAHRLPRHADSVEACFQVALLLGIAAYWLPSVVFVLIPIWGYLIYRNIFSFRSFLASLVGLAVVAIWFGVLNHYSLFTINYSLAHNLWAWIPTGAFLVAWLASTTAQQILRER